MGTKFISGKSGKIKTSVECSIYAKDIILNEKTVIPAVNSPATGSESGKAAKLSKNARNALAEARARRAGINSKAGNEIAGRGGLEPTRYDDWEIKGITSDF